MPAANANAPPTTIVAPWLRACRNPTLLGCMPQGLSRPEGRRAPLPSAIGWHHTREQIMTTIRTSLNLSKYDARRLIKAGYEIEFIETYHGKTGDQNSIVWTRPARPDDLGEDELPF